MEGPYLALTHHSHSRLRFKSLDIGKSIVKKSCITAFLLLTMLSLLFATGFVQVSLPRGLPVGEPRLLLTDDTIWSQQRHAFHASRLPPLRHFPRTEDCEAVRTGPDRLLRLPLLVDNGAVHARCLHY